MVEPERVRSEAGALLQARWQAMRKREETPLSLLGMGGGVQPYRHFPEGDVYDAARCTQFYYHIHRQGDAGHIHLFQRSKGMPAGLTPLVPADEDNAACHLVAVGFGPGGEAAELFTTNRWVTGESWYAAEAVKVMLPGFRIAAAGKLAPVAAWLEALAAFYRPTIAALLDQRDATVRDWGHRHPGADPLNDSGLEITSRRTIDPAADLGI